MEDGRMDGTKCFSTLNNVCLKHFLSARALIAVGIVLLIIGFFFFYLASRDNWNYATTYTKGVNLGYPDYVSELQQFGAWEYWINNVIMQPNDILTVSYERGIPINGTLRIAVLVHMQNTVLASSVDLVSYKNNQENEVVVSVYLYSENMQNTSVTATTALNHYETPQWELFGFGAVLSSLALVPIFKSKK